MNNFTEITSKDNQIIKFVSQLQTSTKQRRTNGLFVLEGLRICRDAYENGIKFEKLIVTKDAFNKHFDIIDMFKTVSDNWTVNKMMNGTFTLDDMLVQMEQINKLGSMKGIMRFIPGMPKVSDEQMERIASRIGDVLVENLYWECIREWGNDMPKLNK